MICREMYVKLVVLYLTQGIKRFLMYTKVNRVGLDRVYCTQLIPWRHYWLKIVIEEIISII